MAAVTSHHKPGDLGTRNVFSHSPGGQKPDIEVCAAVGVGGGPQSFRSLDGSAVPCGHHMAPVCARHHMAFSSVPFIRTLVTGFGAHSDNPEWPHRQVLHLILSAKILLLNKDMFTDSGH